MKNLHNQVEEFEKLISRYIKKNKINHAYLIETNFDNRIDLANSLIKKILDKQESNNFDNLINNYDLQIIKAEGQFIKKEEIISLKEKFKTKSIYNKIRVYVIEEAEKLNNSSANTLLKFLEEPEEDIIAILITNNVNLVINTIVSRCQIIRFFTDKKEIADTNKEYVDMLFQFINKLETEKEKSIAYINEISSKNIQDRQNLSEFLKKMLYVYNDVLHKKINFKINYFVEYDDNITKIAENNSIENIKNKINAINICLDRMKYNANIKLLLDKLIILMSGVDFDV